MCYGNLDPKLALRESEVRLKGLSFESDTAHTPAAQPAFGFVTWLRAAMARLKRKDQAHV